MKRLYTFDAPPENRNRPSPLDELAVFASAPSTTADIGNGAEKLRAWRKSLGLSIESMAKLIGISLAMLQSIELQSRRPGLDLALRIQRLSVWYSVKHARAARDADLDLPILCEDW